MGQQTSSRFFARLLNFYNGILHRHKYPVQIVTGGVLWFSGDLLAQSLTNAAGLLARENAARRDVSGADASGVAAGLAAGVGAGARADDLGHGANAGFVDWTRVGRMTVYGLAVSAPVYAFWYSFLDNWSHRVFSRDKAARHAASHAIVPAPLRHFMQRAPFLRPALLALWQRAPAPAALRLWQMVAFKLAADCFLFDPAYLALFFSATAALEQRAPAEIAHKLRTDLLPTYLVDIAVWLPIQTINFRWVPVMYQALFVQGCNVGWNAYLSFVQHRHPPPIDNKGANAE